MKKLILKYCYYVLLVMRLGKKKEKEKENEPKSQVVEGVSRLIVSPKAQNIPLKCEYQFVFNLSVLW